MKSVVLAVLVALVIASASWAHASEVGHFSPGVASIRDYVVPPPGFYAILYNYMYMSDQINDKNGDKIEQVTIGVPPLSTNLNVDVDLDMHVTTLGLMWSFKQKILGATCGAYVMFPFANTSIGASLTTVTGSGRSFETSQFNFADMFVQPIWLGWKKPNWDIALGYGVYAPTGKYNTEEIVIPIVGEITAEASDNIGLGFWTNQIQGACSYYPWPDRRMAVAGALTYEIHGKKEDFDLTPGQNLTLNWGVSQYLPLTADNKCILEFGPAGYDSWQITDDSGDAARNVSVHDGVHGVGVQIGTMYMPWRTTLNFRYLYEYAATDRFKGQSVGLNLGVAF